MKALSGSSGYKFGVLAKIVNYMKVSTHITKVPLVFFDKIKRELEDGVFRS